MLLRTPLRGCFWLHQQKRWEKMITGKVEFTLFFVAKVLT